MTVPELQAAARLAAIDYVIDPVLFQALIEQESGWNTFAWNPEPRYRYFWNVKARAPFRPLTPIEISSELPPSDFPTLAGDPDQEWWGQQASWGLCQVMGAVAREHGFFGPYLTQLVAPEINLRMGCAHLRQKLKQEAGNVKAALQRWNGGGDPSYADKVLARIGHYPSVNSLLRSDTIHAG